MDYALAAGRLGIPQNATVKLLAADATKTLVTVRSANYTLYVQRITYTPSTVAAQAILIKDTTGTPVDLALIPASQALPWTADFGPEGVAMAAGKDLVCSNTAGPAGTFHIECYAKLSAVIAYTAANQ